MSVHGGKKLLIHEAAQALGLPRKTVQQACNVGRLPAVKEQRWTVQGLRWVYVITSEDLDAYRAYRDRTPQLSRRWTPDEDAALLELITSCTPHQVGAYLGFSPKAVQLRLRRLGVGRRLTEKRPMVPFTIPKSGILLAKSCSRCGELRGRDAYKAASNGARYSSECRVCGNADSREKYLHSNYRKVRQELQAHTVDNAHKHGQEWTSTEDERLKDYSLSSYGLALELGRTMEAVTARRHRLGMNPRGVVKRATGRWAIDFPATQAEVEDYFRRLGPVPEELWEWSDERRSA